MQSIETLHNQTTRKPVAAVFTRGAHGPCTKVHGPCILHTGCVRKYTDRVTRG